MLYSITSLSTVKVFQTPSTFPFPNCKDYLPQLDRFLLLQNKIFETHTGCMSSITSALWYFLSDTLGSMASLNPYYTARYFFPADLSSLLRNRLKKKTSGRTTATFKTLMLPVSTRREQIQQDSSWAHVNWHTWRFYSTEHPKPRLFWSGSGLLM